ncbi:MAG TPA: flagellin [Chloroflexota bacterium]|jgi:flagellin|nr:flagellin [Chloroflexota bacterium]
MVSINTNVSSLNSTRLLNITNSSLNRTTERLSSGLRINRAADDPSGLFAAESFTSEIRGSQAAVGNIQQATSVVQLADAGLSNIFDALQRMKELAVSASSGAITADQRNALNAEYVAIRSSIDTVVNGTTFGGQSLLDGGYGSVTLQVGAQTTALGTLDLTADYTAGNLVATANINSVANANTAQGEIDAAITTVASGRANLGATISGLDYQKAALEVGVVANTEARSRIQDADIASEVSSLVRQQITQQAGASALSAANFSTQFVLQLLQ